MALCVNTPDHRKDVIQWIKDQTNRGATVELVNSEDIRNGTVRFGHTCDKAERVQKEFR